MSDENMKGRERIWEYIHDKIETRLSELETRIEKYKKDFISDIINEQTKLEKRVRDLESWQKNHRHSNIYGGYK